VKVVSSKFGELSISKADIIHFEEGLLGFEEYKEYTIIDPNDNTFILWMQSITNPDIAFPVIEPQVFKPDYKAPLLPIDLKYLNLDENAQIRTYVILTIPKDIQLLSANLKAPIIVNAEKSLAKQIVLQDSKLSVKHEMFKELKLAISSRTKSSDDQNRTTVDPVENNKKPDSVVKTHRPSEEGKTANT
jgi:flagellar assembly factor FliW